jgi:hypothetical protein
MIQGLVGRGKLPKVFSDTFDTATEALRVELQDVDNARARQAAVSGRTDPVALHQAAKDAEGLLRADQLYRNWDKAVKRKAAAPAAATGDQVLNQMFVLPAENLQQFLQQTPQGFDPNGPNVINSP